MQILYLSQYFPPEMGAPSARVFELSRFWVKQGAKVTVLTGFPHHPTGVIPEQYKGYRFLEENISGIHVIRTYVYATANKGFFKRIFSYFSFMLSSIIQGARKVKQCDIIIATSPQFFVGIAGYLISRMLKKPFVFEVRDLWPESIVQLGQIKNPVLIKFLEWIEMFLYKKAIHIVGVADSTLDLLVKRGIPGEKISIIKNGVDLTLFKSSHKQTELKRKHGFEKKYIVSYIGTHGLSHALDKVLETAALLKDVEEILFLFIGEGAEKENLVKQAKDNQLANVVFHDQIDKKILPEFYDLSDIILVTLKKLPLFTCVIPSKIFEIMAMEKPILISVEGESRALVEKAQAGIFVEPENPTQLKEKIVYLFHHPEIAKRLGQNGRKFVENYFNRDAQAKEYLSLIQKLVEDNEKKSH